MVWGISSFRTRTAEHQSLLREPSNNCDTAGRRASRDIFEHVPDAAIAFCGGALAFAGSYTAVQGIFTLAARAPVPAAADYWANLAREQVYERCYNGCASTSFDRDAGAYLACPETACLTSALVTLANITCDANQMWYWKDRLPTQCLAPLGDILHQRALKEAQRHVVHHEVWGVVIGLACGLIGAASALTLTRSWRRGDHGTASESN